MPYYRLDLGSHVLRDELLQTDTGLWDSIHEVLIFERFARMIPTLINPLYHMRKFRDYIVFVLEKCTSIIVNILPPPEEIFIYENRYVFD